jgi:hypothetical protein
VRVGVRKRRRRPGAPAGKAAGRSGSKIKQWEGEGGGEGL